MISRVELGSGDCIIEIAAGYALAMTRGQGVRDKEAWIPDQVRDDRG